MGGLLGGGGGGGAKGMLPSHIIGGGPEHVHICFYKTGIKPADFVLPYTRGLEWETVLCMIIALSEGF